MANCLHCETGTIESQTPDKLVCNNCGSVYIRKKRRR